MEDKIIKAMAEAFDKFEKYEKVKKIIEEYKRQPSGISMSNVYKENKE